MGIWDNMIMALTSIKANKMRSLLTMLGIIIGISSVIAIMTVGDSLSNTVSDSLSSMGLANITVSVASKSSSSNDSFLRMFTRSSYSEEDLFTDEMINEYREAFGEYIDAISISESVGSQKLYNGEEDASVSVMGVNVDYANANDIEMLTGRFVSEDDMANYRKVCVISDQALEDLGYSVTNAIGKSLEITIGGHTQLFYICGIYHYEEESSSFIQTETTTTLYIPIATAKYWTKGNKGYSSITVVGKASADSEALLNATQTYFASYYTRNDTYTANASNMTSMVETMTDLLSTITLAISAIAAISLLVGGIGVMNIMLVSITERTKEIGIRKSLGATGNAIRIQFIIEAMIICMIGGLIGVVLGIGLGMIACKIVGYSGVVSISTCLLAVGFSMAVGIFFGYYPANKAAKMNPIDALRYE